MGQENPLPYLFSQVSVYICPEYPHIDTVDQAYKTCVYSFDIYNLASSVMHKIVQLCFFLNFK